MVSSSDLTLSVASAEEIGHLVLVLSELQVCLCPFLFLLLFLLLLSVHLCLSACILCDCFMCVVCMHVGVCIPVRAVCSSVCACVCVCVSLSHAFCLCLHVMYMSV